MKRIFIIITIFILQVFPQSQDLTLECKSKTILDTLELSEFNYSTDGGVVRKILCDDKILYEIELFSESWNRYAELIPNRSQFTVYEVMTKYNVPYYDTTNFDFKKAMIDTTIKILNPNIKNEYSFYLEIIKILNQKYLSNKIPDGSYGLSHKFLNSDTSKIIPTPEENIVVKNDSVFYFGFEPYSPVAKGIIWNNHFRFNKGDTIKFRQVENGFNTYKDSLVYKWLLYED